MNDEVKEIFQFIGDRQAQIDRETKYLEALASMTREISRLTSENIRLESELRALESSVAGDTLTS